MIKSTNTYEETKMVDKNQEIEIRPNGSRRVRTINIEPTMTDPQWADECDVNHIMKKYQATGTINHVRETMGKYADLTSVGDYQEMLDQVLYAKEAFMELPAQVRYKFENDPGKLLGFLQDPKNYDEAQKLGLVEKRKEPETTLKDVKDAINASNTKKVSKAEKVVSTPSTES